MLMFITTSNNRWYLAISAVIFTVIGIAHLALILLQMPAIVGTYTVPYEVNGMVVILMGYLATRGFIAAHRL